MTIEELKALATHFLADDGECDENAFIDSVRFFMDDAGSKEVRKIASLLSEMKD